MYISCKKNDTANTLPKNEHHEIHAYRNYIRILHQILLSEGVLYLEQIQKSLTSLMKPSWTSSTANSCTFSSKNTQELTS